MRDQWMDRLSEYVDGELTPAEQAALEAHLGTCADCPAVLDELRGVVARAQALDDRPPAQDLWPGIAALIGAAPAAPSLRPGQARAPARSRTRVLTFRTFAFTVPQLAAAALALMIGSGALVYQLGGRAGAGAGGGARSTVAAVRPGDEIPVEVRAAAALGEVRIDSTVAELELALEEGSGTLDTSTVRILRQNLAIIDSAIAQARRALMADPGNVYLNNNLAGSMRRKVELLRRATGLVAAQS